MILSSAAVLVVCAMQQMSPVQPAVADVVTLAAPSSVHLGGFLGDRVDANAKRLVAVDLEPLLAGFKRKPGSHPWIGEHIGKWMHGATLTWQYVEDPELKQSLRAQLDSAAAQLIAAQEPDGYLGTYTPDKRFGQFPEADWDVWSHKYCMIGLLTYHAYTGDKEALSAAAKAADLLIATFDTAHGGKSINSAGTHVGMAATSVLEPVVMLYRATGDAKYLRFAQSIVNAYDEPGGPGIVKSLVANGSVAKTANGKAYEMLSNLVGVCELYRATGEKRLIEAAKNGFDDVVKNQLYVTGTASWGEHFHADHELPNRESAAVGETCVTVTWMQLCSQLFRLTGEARYADELERSIYNHLAAAQRPDGAAWCYYTSLDGKKPYGSSTNCCLSSGPRGMAMVPSVVFATARPASASGRDIVVVNLFEPATATLMVNGTETRVSLSTEFPLKPDATLTIDPRHAGDTKIGVLVRAPAWAAPVTIGSVESRTTADGWVEILPRAWNASEGVRIRFALKSAIKARTFTNAGLACAQWGPMALAYDESMNAKCPAAPLVWFDPAGPVEREPGSSRGVLSFTAPMVAAPDGKRFIGRLTPFATAGATGGRYRVWLGAPGAFNPKTFDPLTAAVESRSRPGNVAGSILDGSTGTFVVTFDGQRRDEDWFAVTFPSAVAASSVTFAHGHTFHDGGWFDRSAGPVRVEYQRSVDGPWEAAGVLDGYPQTTRTDPRGLAHGERFTLAFDQPVTVVGVRVVGVPASGDNASQSFASCSELSIASTPAKSTNTTGESQR